MVALHHARNVIVASTARPLRWAAKHLALALTLCSTRAHAQLESDQAPRLRWEAPAGCPTQDEVLAELEHLARRPLRGAGAPAVQARAVVTQSADGQWRVELDTEIEGHTGHRRLQADRCERAGHATAVVIALAIEGALAQQAPEPPVAPVEPPPPAPAPVAPPVPQQASPRPAPTTFFSAELLASLEAFALGTPLVGGTLRLGLGVRSLRLAGQVSVWSERRAALPSGPGGTFRLVTAALRGCWMPLATRVELGPCVAFEAGMLAAQGFGTDVVEAHRALWLAVLLGPRFLWRVHRWVGLGLGVELALTALRPTFVFDNLGTVLQPALASLRAEAGLEVRFP